MVNNPKYLTIKQACELLGVSRPTFDKIRKRRNLKQLMRGQRPRFLREEIEAISEPVPVSNLALDERIDLSVFNTATTFDLEIAPDAFDLGRLRDFDPQGVLNLFCALVERGRQGRVVQLLVEDNFICNHLRSLGFFNQLEAAIPGKVLWARDKLKTDHTSYKYPIGLTKISLPKEEVPVVEKLIRLLREQGFSDQIGGYIAWIFGELTDNANTYLRIGDYNYQAECYLLAQRYKFSTSGSDCLIIGVADIGPGIHETIKRNPKYKEISDKEALLSAFKPGVSSWPDEYKRGRGLTDIMAIAMGNKSVFRVESGGNIFSADFRNKTDNFSVDPRKPGGTRFSLVVIDHDFEMKKRDEVTNYIDKVLAKK